MMKLKDGESQEKASFDSKLFRVYGLPFTESHGSSLLPQDPNTKKPYKDLAGLATWEFMYNRITSNNFKCGRYEVCHGSDKFTIECAFDQWNKKIAY